MEYDCRVKITIGREKKFFGPGVERLLLLVKKHHSLRKATNEMNMAYSKALKIIRYAESELGIPLIETKVGGSEGGGSYLTAQGEVFLEKYSRFREVLEAQAEQEFIRIFAEEEQHGHL